MLRKLFVVVLGLLLVSMIAETAFAGSEGFIDFCRVKTVYVGR